MSNALYYLIVACNRNRSHNTNTNR